MIRTVESLQELLDSEDYHEWMISPDERSDRASWTILGDWRHEFVWIILKNEQTGDQAIACHRSIHSPDTLTMEYQVEGIFAEDAMMIEHNAEDMWSKNQRRLRL